MKHFIFGTSLLTLLLTFCLGTSMYIDDTISKTEALLNASIGLQAQNRYQDAAFYLRLSEKQWNKSLNFYATVLCHEELDQITTEFYRLNICMDICDIDELTGNCASLLQQLRHIRTMAWPYLQNVF